MLGEEEIVDHDPDLGRQSEEWERLVGLDAGLGHCEFWPALDSSELLVTVLDGGRS